MKNHWYDNTVYVSCQLNEKIIPMVNNVSVLLQYVKALNKLKKKITF